MGIFPSIDCSPKKHGEKSPWTPFERAVSWFALRCQSEPANTTRKLCVTKCDTVQDGMVERSQSTEAIVPPGRKLPAPHCERSRSWDLPVVTRLTWESILDHFSLAWQQLFRRRSGKMSIFPGLSSCGVPCILFIMCCSTSFKPHAFHVVGNMLPKT